MGPGWMSNKNLTLSLKSYVSEKDLTFYSEQLTLSVLEELHDAMHPFLFCPSG